MNPLRPPDTFTKMVARFTVWGQPVPQGSVTAVVQPHSPRVKNGTCRGGIARMVQNADMGAGEKRNRLKDWRAHVKACAEIHYARVLGTPIDGPCEVVVTFYLPRPASAPARVRYPHTGLDVDKMARAVGDALTDARIFTNDARVCSLVASKRFAPVGTAPGAEIGVFVQP